jgi:hypothetical protein
MLESPAGPARIHKGADRGPTGANGVPQDASQAVIKPEKGFFSQRISPSPGVDSSAMENLIGINVSHPGQELLVQKERFNRPMPQLRAPDKILWGNVERLGTQVREGSKLAPYPFLFHPEPAELTRVHVTKLAELALKRKDHMGMLFQGCLGGDKPQPSGHAQMDSQSHPTAQVEDDVFPLPFSAEDFPSPQGGDKRFL